MSQQEDLLTNVRTWTVSRKRGQLIFDAGETPRNMYRVESGCVRLQVRGLQGDRQIVVFLFPGDLFGYDIEDRICSAEAACDSALRCWVVAAMLNGTDNRAKMTITLLEAAQHRFAGMAAHIETVTHLSAKERVIWFLNGLLSCPGLPKADGRLHLPMSHMDIANYLGLAPETFSRVLADLEVDQYLRRVGRHDLELTPEAFLRVRHSADLKQS